MTQADEERTIAYDGHEGQQEEDGRLLRWADTRNEQELAECLPPLVLSDYHMSYFIFLTLIVLKVKALIDFGKH